MEHLKKELVNIGLSENEAAVYLAALSLGKGTIQEIARKAGIKRVTTYGVIDSLMEDGLASSTHEGKKQYYMAEDPERVIDYLERKKKDFEEKEARMKEMLPQLKEMHQNASHSPIVKYYTGKDGVISMIKNMLDLEKDEEIWMAYPAENVYELFSDEERAEIAFSQKQKQIKIHSLYTKKGTPLENTDISERVRIPADKYPLDADVAVYNDKIRLTTLRGDLVGIVIENKDIANTLKSLLKFAVDKTKKNN